MAGLTRFSFAVMRLLVPRTLAIFVRYTWPWIWWALKSSFYFSALGLVTLWAGVPETIRKISVKTTEDAVSSGLPQALAQPLYYTVVSISIAQIVAGWLILARITELLIRLIF